jgi:hypothetical protein
VPDLPDVEPARQIENFPFDVLITRARRVVLRPQGQGPLHHRSRPLRAGARPAANRGRDFRSGRRIGSIGRLALDVGVSILLRNQLARAFRDFRRLASNRSVVQLANGAEVITNDENKFKRGIECRVRPRRLESLGKDDARNRGAGTDALGRGS